MPAKEHISPVNLTQLPLQTTLMPQTHCCACALQTLQSTLQQQQEQRASMLNEQDGFRRQLVQQKQRNEQAAEVQRKLEAQAERLSAQIERIRVRQAELKVGAAGLQQGCLGGQPQCCIMRRALCMEVLLDLGRLDDVVCRATGDLEPLTAVAS